MKKNLSTILRAGALAALFVVGTSASAFALPIVNFGTSGTFSGGGGILESYYDGKIIRFEIIENQANFTEEQVIYVFSKSKNVFKNGVKFPI